MNLNDNIYIDNEDVSIHNYKLEASDDSSLLDDELEISKDNNKDNVYDIVSSINYNNYHIYYKNILLD